MSDMHDKAIEAACEALDADIWAMLPEHDPENGYDRQAAREKQRAACAAFLRETAMQIFNKYHDNDDGCFAEQCDLLATELEQP